MTSYVYYGNLKYPNVNNYNSTNSFFLTSDIFVNYVNKLFKNRKSVCSFMSDTIDQHFIEIDVVNLSYKMSNNFKYYLNKCKQKDTRFFIIPINLRFVNKFENETNTKTVGHSNVVIVDNKNFTIEFFEPHGKSYYGELDKNLLFDTEKLIKTVIFDILPSDHLLYYFSNVYEMCPYLGIQQDDGFCLGWSLFLIELKLLNPNITTSVIVLSISSWSREFSINYIKQYLGYIESLNLPNSKMNVAFPEYKIFLKLSDIINPQAIKQRIIFLLMATDFQLVSSQQRLELIYKVLKYYVYYP